MVKVSAILLLPAMIGLVAINAYSSTQGPKKDGTAAFKRYVGVYTKKFPLQQMVLQNARIKQLGNRAFLVGTPVGEANNSRKLTTRNSVVWWLPLSEVTEFYEFDDSKGYRDDGKEPRYQIKPPVIAPFREP